MTTDLVALVADLIPRPAVSAHVADWPQDEQDYYRDHRGSFTDCNRELDRMRQEKAARAILAALRIKPGHRPAGVHDHSSTDPWSYGPGGDTAYVDGCPVTPLTPEQATASAVGSARLAGYDPDPEWVARVAEAAESPGGVDALIAEHAERGESVPASWLDEIRDYGDTFRCDAIKAGGVCSGKHISGWGGGLVGISRCEMGHYIVGRIAGLRAGINLPDAAEEPV